MPSTDLLFAFFLAAAVFAYMPGPAMLYTTAQTIARGRRAGWMAALGIHLGGYVHVLAAAFGLAALFAVVPALYVMVKLAGGAYLIWLGVMLITARSETSTAPAAMAPKSPRRAFWESVTVEVLNPKTALFFLAFLPQFTDPAASLPIWAQLLVLGAIVNAMFSSADIVCVVLADRISAMFRTSPAIGRITRRIGGGILVALGLNHVLDRQ